MTCFVTVHGAIAFRPDTTSAIERIRVWGTVACIGIDPADCAEITVRATLGADSFEATDSVDDAGGWSFDVDVSAGNWSCGTAAPLDIDAFCTANPQFSAETKSEELHCQTEGSCPVFAKVAVSLVDATDDGCDDGERSVAFSSTLLNWPDGAGPVTASIYVRPVGGDEQDEDIVAVGALLSGDVLEGTHPLEGGTYEYGVRVVSPSPCEGPTGAVEVPPCPPSEVTPVCPGIAFGAASVSDKCTPDGKRSVTGSVVVTPVPGHPAAARLLVMQGGNEVAELGATGSQVGAFALEGTANLAPGDYSFSVDVSAPAGCNTADTPLTVPECPEGPIVTSPLPDPECPDIRIDPPDISGLCDDNGQRKLVASATVTPAQNTPVTARLVVSGSDGVGTVLDSMEDTTAVTELSGTTDLSPGTYTLAVDVSTPARCESPAEPISIENCGAPPARPFRLRLCPFILFMGLFLAVYGGLLLGFGFCLSSFAAHPAVATLTIALVVVGLILHVIGVLLLLFWILVCGSCRTNCNQLNWLTTVLGYLALGSGLLALLATVLLVFGNPCFLGWAIDAVDFGLLFTLAFFWRKAAGCDPWPAGWPPQLTFTVPRFLRDLCTRL